MANLYELATDYANLQDAFENDNLTREELEAILDAMEESRDDLRVKVDNTCRLLRNADGEIKKFKEEEARLAARRKALENKRRHVHDWLKSTLDLLNVKNVKTDLFHVSIVVNGHRIVVVDESKIPEEFWKVKREPDKTKLGKAYKEDGHVVDGCETAPVVQMRIR